MPPSLTDDGIDATFQANALAPWLLMTQLAGKLGTGRVLLTNSRAHNNAVLSLHNIAAGVLLREFHRHNPGVDAGDFHPGLIASDFGRYMGRTGSLLKTATRQQALDGTYFVHARPAKGSAQLHSEELGTALSEAADRATASASNSAG